MNTSLFNIIKCITARHGEGILGDAARLKTLVRGYAKGEPKEDRVAFGRAVEQGFYRKLKYTATAERPQVKAALALRLQALTGFDAPRCAAAVGLLDALITPAPKIMPQKNWRIAAACAAAVILIFAWSKTFKEKPEGAPPAPPQAYTPHAAPARTPAPEAPSHGVIPRYAQEEAVRFKAEFLRENTASASDLAYRFFYNDKDEACLEYTVTPKGRYTWPKPIWIGFTWGNSTGFIAEGKTNYTITKRKLDEAAYRMEERRNDPVFWEIEQKILQIAREYDYDFYAASGTAVKYRNSTIKKAVCEGYAEAVAEILQDHALVRAAEIWVSDSGNHAWNIIALQDGRQLYCDATWYDGNSVDDEGYVVNEPVQNPVDLTFDKTEFNTMGGAVDTYSGRPLAVHFAWGDARKR